MRTSIMYFRRYILDRYVSQLVRNCAQRFDLRTFFLGRISVDLHPPFKAFNLAQAATQFRKGAFEKAN